MNIVFDFGAVLFDWQPARLVRKAFPLHAPTEAAAQALAVDIFRHEDWHAFDQGLLAQEEVIARTLLRLGLPEPALFALVDHIGERLTPIPETTAVLERLCKQRDAGVVVGGAPVKLYYLSNMPAPYARVLSERHSFLKWFDGGIYSGDVRLIKPDPDIFQLLAKRHDLMPQHTVFIDDLLANVEAARALGWAGIHFQNAAQLAQDLAALGVPPAR